MVLLGVLNYRAIVTFVGYSEVSYSLSLEAL